MKNADFARREERSLARSQTIASPHRVLERFADEVDRVFEDFGVGRGLARPGFGSSWLAQATSAEMTWTPDVEVLHQNDQLIVRADLPGLTKDDIKVDVSEDHLTIQGERRHQHEEERDGVYRSERSYGAFRRDIPLPPGTISDQAKASVRNGVLEITMPAAPESARRGRRLDVSDQSVNTSNQGAKR
jgi:HSP20 family protein